LGGPDATWVPGVDDDNPPRFYEPLPSGPEKGKTTDRKAVERYKKRYFRAVGWDSLGVPTSEALVKLGLNDVDKRLEKVRNRKAS